VPSANASVAIEKARITGMATNIEAVKTRGERTLGLFKVCSDQVLVSERDIKEDFPPKTPTLN
jgi:hypothetical protein